MKRALILALVTYVAFALVVVLYGESATRMLGLVVEGTWASGYGVGQVLFKATPLLLTGLAAVVAYRAGLVNVGAEGQLAVGGFAAAYVGAHVQGRASVLLACMSACAAGALWALLPIFMKVTNGISEIITTLMMNKVAEALVAYALGHGFAQPGTVRTDSVTEGARLTPLSAWVSSFSGSAVSTALFLAVVLTFVGPSVLRRTAVGREWMLIGQNRRACEIALMDVRKREIQAFLVSGALAGLAASATVLGYKGYFEQGIGAGAGFTGLAVGLFGEGLPMALGALLFGTLDQGGLAMNAYVPRDVMQIVIATVIIAVSMKGRKA